LPVDDPYHAQNLDDLLDAGAESRSWTLTKDAPHRLDTHLRSKLKGMSRNQVQRLIAMGGVTVNDAPAKASTHLKQGDTVTVVVPPRPASDIQPEPIPIEVLYEDDDMIVVNKHAGIIVHPARGEQTGTMLHALAHHFQEADAERSEASGTGRLSPTGTADARPGVVHRLDRHTTGVIVFAKREAAHAFIATQFERRTNLKAYLALVHGIPQPLSGAIDQPLGKHPTYREAFAVRHDHTGRDSLTLYRTRRLYPRPQEAAPEADAERSEASGPRTPHTWGARPPLRSGVCDPGSGVIRLRRTGSLNTNAGYALVEFELKTGRTHQIRVHSTYIGHPLVGDLVYGGMITGPPELASAPLSPAHRPHLTFARSREEGQKLEAQATTRAAAGEAPLMAVPALHAALLRIHRFSDNQPITFTAPVPAPLRDMIHHLEQGTAHPGITDGTHIDLQTALGLPDV
jgi:23S rRNA pseudouridine1911/1915/1917 synthase